MGDHACASGDENDFGWGVVVSYTKQNVGRPQKGVTTSVIGAEGSGLRQAVLGAGHVDVVQTRRRQLGLPTRQPLEDPTGLIVLRGGEPEDVVELDHLRFVNAPVEISELEP